MIEPDYKTYKIGYYELTLFDNKNVTIENHHYAPVTDTYIDYIYTNGVLLIKYDRDEDGDYFYDIYHGHCLNEFYDSNDIDNIYIINNTIYCETSEDIICIGGMGYILYIPKPENYNDSEKMRLIEKFENDKLTYDDNGHNYLTNKLPYESMLFEIIEFPNSAIIKATSALEIFTCITTHKILKAEVFYTDGTTEELPEDMINIIVELILEQNGYYLQDFC